MKVGTGGNLGLNREYHKKLFGPLFYPCWNCPLKISLKTLPASQGFNFCKFSTVGNFTLPSTYLYCFPIDIGVKDQVLAAALSLSFS